MHFFGCLIILALLAVFIVLALLVKVLGYAKFFVKLAGDTCVWLFESFCNLFRKDKKEVFNPYTGSTNFDHITQEEELEYHDVTALPKRYDDTDGDVIDGVEEI